MPGLRILGPKTRRLRFLRLLILTLLTILSLTTASTRATPAQQSTFPFQDPSLPLDTRVNDLVSRLTLSEKISLLHQYQPAIPRLGIASFRTGTEALHGVAWLGTATVFPQAIGLGSTWDPPLIKQVGAAVGDEVRGYNFRNRASNGLNVWAPVVDFSASVSKGDSGSANIEIRLDSPSGPLVGTSTAAGTGGWYNWATSSTSVSGAAGVHAVYLVFRGSMNIRSFSFQASGGATSTLTPTRTNTPPTPTRTPTRTPTVGAASNLAQGRPASADSAQTANPAASGNDGNTSSRWSANNGSTSHWWQVDLGTARSLTGSEVMWEFSGRVYQYRVEVSADAATWTTVVNKTSNTSTAQTQRDNFSATARFVRISVTGLPASPVTWASFWEFRVFGS